MLGKREGQDLAVDTRANQLTCRGEVGLRFMADNVLLNQGSCQQRQLAHEACAVHAELQLVVVGKVAAHVGIQAGKLLLSWLHRGQLLMYVHKRRSDYFGCKFMFFFRNRQTLHVHFSLRRARRLFFYSYLCSAKHYFSHVRTRKNSSATR